jgi:lysophospholipase L1-like esterase
MLRVPTDPPLRSFVAVGDSFTEGLNDELPDGTFGGWADRLAVTLARQAGPDGFRYANLAVRGRLLDAIVAEQVPTAIDAAPELISFSAGGNDVLRPGFDPDGAARRYEKALARLRATDARVIVFTGFDPGRTPVLRLARGRIAIYNELLRGVAARHGADLVDLWSLTPLRDPRAFSGDRLHLTAGGHERVARLVARTLGIDMGDPYESWPRLAAAERSRREDLIWVRAHLLPWVGRHLRGRSSGDGLLPKRPGLDLFAPVEVD